MICDTIYYIYVIIHAETAKYTFSKSIVYAYLTIWLIRYYIVRF